MKNTIYILFLLIFISCHKQAQFQKIYLNGNWSYLDTDLEYYEVHIDSSNMFFYSDEGGLLPKMKYKIKEDSLFMFYSSGKKFSMPYVYRIMEDQVFLLDKKLKDTLIRMKKIKTSEFSFDKIENFDNDKEMIRFKVDYFNRKNSMLGIDSTYNYEDLLVKFKNHQLKEIPEIHEPKTKQN